VGADNVEHNPASNMGSEDFAHMLREKPGCYIWIGGGAKKRDTILHNSRYDFNDEILPIGSSYWARLVEVVLG
jgi:hippurate hydrolase